MTQRTKPLRWWEALLVDFFVDLRLFTKALLVGAGFTLGVMGMIGWLS